MRDPYYQKILAGLEGPLDPYAFEECARSLLRDAYPSLAAVHGGSDAGMDGAIADEDGEAYPLVVTTAEDFARNLRDNLASYVRSGKKRRRAVFATSRRVTPTTRRELEKIALEEHGFTLVNIHDKYDFTERLYSNSRLTRELLGITDDPPALSAVPRTCRPLPEIELVGREADLRWLRETEGHRLVVGQPGSGKTALLLQLVREGSALFLASDDEARIAEAYRDSRPALILVDDAHLEPEKLVRLRQIQGDIEADFEIVASAWPGAEDDVADALGIGGGSIRHLELLTRAEILQVLRGIGISELNDDPYLHLLVDQSANKPGLAVTLGSLWLRGEGRDVVTGKALRRSLIPALKRILEHDPTQLLACFALGGDRGLSMETVAVFLETGRGEIHRKATLASQGGVLAVRGELLSVQPEALRSALLEEVFFTRARPPLTHYRGLLDRAPDRGSAVETLAKAAERGVKIPRDELQELLLEAGSHQAWQAFARLDENEGRWVLEHFPENIAAVSAELLQSAPRPTIRRLLHEAEGAGGPLHSQRDHPLRLLQEWVEDIPASLDYSEQINEILQRRRVLVHEAKMHLRRGGDRTVGLRASILALSLRLESLRRVATGDAVLNREGILPSSSVPHILELWAEIREDLGELTPAIWSDLEKILRDWVWPHPFSPTEDKTDRFRDVARRIMSDLVEQAQVRPGLYLAMRYWAVRMEIPLALPEDTEFVVLFPYIDHESESWEEEEEKSFQAARELAVQLTLRSPLAVSQQLARYAAEAVEFGHRDSAAIWDFSHTLAKEVDAPEEWLSAFADARLPTNWLRPMLERVVREQHGEWQRILLIFLETDDYALLAGDLTIRSERVPEELIDTALTRLPADLVETACSQRRVPLGTLRTLLGHAREDIAVAAAIGEWLSEPRGETRKQIRAEWQRAVLRLGSAGRLERNRAGSAYWLKKILGSDSDLAVAWLLDRVNDLTGYEPVWKDGIYAAAIQPLPNDRRKELLRQLPDSLFGGELIPLLVGDSADLYRCLLAQDRLRQHHLAPLAGTPPDAAWTELVQMALDAGHEPQAIAKVAFEYVGVGSGTYIEHWGRWKEAFSMLLGTAQGDLQEVAGYGLQIAKDLISRREKEIRRSAGTADF